MQASEFKNRVDTFLERRLQEEGTINAMMQMKMVSYDAMDQTVVLAFPIEPWQSNPVGGMHGGMIASAFDIALACAAYVAGHATFTPTIHMAMDYVGVIKVGDQLIIESICDHCGSRIAHVRGIARAKSTGKVIATAIGTYAMNTR